MKMGPYTDAHANPQGPGDSRPTALQIVRDEDIEGKLSGRVMVVTGVTSGIGLETARALAATGTTLFLTVRDMKKAETALCDILEPGRVSLVHMDNSSLASVRTAAATILDKTKNLVHILVANAGVMGFEDQTLSADGHEMHFATNHLGHFLFFQLLKPALLASSSPSFHSRVVMVASSAHRLDCLNEDYDFQSGGYNYEAAYANSKLANVYMANEIDRRYAQQGLHATSVHPGGINTELKRNRGPEFLEAIMSNEHVARLLKSAEQGAATTVLAAIGKGWEDRGGKYLEDCQEAEQGEDDKSMWGIGFVSHTYNQDAEQRLWRDSLKLVGCSDDQQ